MLQTDMRSVGPTNSLDTSYLKHSTMWYRNHIGKMEIQRGRGARWTHSNSVHKDAHTK